MKNINSVLFLLFFSIHFSIVYAQKNLPSQKQEQCATMQRLAAKFERNPALKIRFTQQLETFNRMMINKSARPIMPDGVLNANGNTIYTIPVVFHIVLTDPTVVTDAQILSQLDILNKTYSGTGADSVRLPDYFKSIFGKSGIRFCLAQRTPDGEATTGINRMATAKSSFSASDDGVKHTAMGGVNLWNADKYFNIWICVLGDDLLGYSTFPNDGQPDEQGVVIDYRSMPGGSSTYFNGGKTLTHETGHYFNLFHIWGDDDGACTGSDYVDDTPNQGNSTSGCYTGIKTDNCTTSGNGILYQDYMDYSNDQCMLLFTSLQDARMETALLTYRASLTVSDGCTPALVKTLDAKLISIESPAQRICTSNFTPFVTIGNRGSKTLTSLVISAVIDNVDTVNYTWNGTLPLLAITNVTLNPVTIGQGDHHLKIFVSSPDSGTDENNSNDTLTTNVQYYDAVSALNEGFEGNTFPPRGWDIVNPDESITWQKVNGIAKTGNASVMINNFDYTNTGQNDYLRLPSLDLVNIDSAYLSFQVAAATFTATSTTNNNWDTLEVLISKDCGTTYTSLYQKWGAKLVTSATERTRSFEPASTEWRKDSVNLTPYINGGTIMLAFRNTTEFENNIYLDDINIKTQIINPNLKATGFLVTPNPASGNITVQFYPNPVNLKGIQLYNMLGQKLAETIILSGQGAAVYNFDISRYAAGTYVVRAIFSDKVLMRKIIRN
ncbi:MAG: M43 family zinc metalloprotease [Ferruginibacter sp.]